MRDATLQTGAIDVQAMTMALAALLVLPLPRLTCHKPLDRICQKPILMLLAGMALCLYAALAWNMAFMASRPWYQGATSTEGQVYCIMFSPKCSANLDANLLNNHIRLPVLTSCSQHGVSD